MGHGCDWRNFEKIPEAIFAMGMGRGGPRWSSFGHGWGDWSDNWGRGRGRRRMFEAGELRLVLLKLIAHEPRHGYDLMRAIEEMTDGAYAPSPGVVYPTLTMLQDMGFIEEKGGKGARKAFAVTDEGTAHLAENAEEVEALFERLREQGEHQRKAGGPPVGRAVGNLMSVLWHRVWRGEANDEQHHEIAAILDEAAQKIERLK